MAGQGPSGSGPSVDHGREPCPDRILDDIGGAFGMGAVGGGLWHLLKGVKNSPSNARMRGGIEVCGQAHVVSLTHLLAASTSHQFYHHPPFVQIAVTGIAGVLVVSTTGYSSCSKSRKEKTSLQAIRREAPKIGGSFAVWGGLFSTFDCTLVAIRRKASRGAYLILS